MTKLDARERLERSMTSTAVQRVVVDVAVGLGWEWCHWRAAPRPGGSARRGWAVPVEGTLGAGWPDLFLIQPNRHVAIGIECKREVNDPATAQQIHVGELLMLAGIGWYVIRPSDLRDPLADSILVRVLMAEARRPLAR